VSKFNDKFHKDYLDDIYETSEEIYDDRKTRKVSNHRKDKNNKSEEKIKQLRREDLKYTEQ
jgi:hypothetical protein